MTDFDGLDNDEDNEMEDEVLEDFYEVDDGMWDYDGLNHHAHINELRCPGADHDGLDEEEADACWGVSYELAVGANDEENGCEPVAIFRHLGHAMIAGAAVVQELERATVDVAVSLSGDGNDSVDSDGSRE